MKSKKPCITLHFTKLMQGIASAASEKKIILVHLFVHGKRVLTDVHAL